MAGGKHFLNAAFLFKDRAQFDVAVNAGCVCIGSANEFVKSVEIQTKVQIVNESFFLVADIDKGRVKGGHYLLDFSKIGVTYGDLMLPSGFFVKFDKPVVFLQGYSDFRRTYVYD